MRLVDERRAAAGRGDQLVELEAAAQVERGQPGDVQLRPRRADLAAEDAQAASASCRGRSRRGRRCRHADQHQRAARRPAAAAPPRRPRAGRRRHDHRVEAAATRWQPAPPRRPARSQPPRPARARPRAWPPSGRSPAIRPAPASAAPWTAFSPTPPSPTTHDAAAGLDGRGRQHRADAGQHPAAEQRRGLQVDRGRHRHHLGSVRPPPARRSRRREAPGAPARRRAAEAASARRPPASRAARTAPAARAGSVAQRPQARTSVTTTWSPTRIPSTPSPSSSTTPATSWPIHRRQVAAPGAARVGEVAVADRAGGDPHADLAAAAGRRSTCSTCQGSPKA